MTFPPVRDLSNPEYPIIRTRESAVSALCWDWVLAKCLGIGFKCPNNHRHFFISESERSHALRSRMLEDAVLERTVVSTITEREALVDALKDAVESKRREFLESTTVRQVTQADMADVLAIMNERELVYIGGVRVCVCACVCVLCVCVCIVCELCCVCDVLAVRVVSVKVIEAIERWRHVQEARAKAKARAATFSKSGGKVMRMFSVRLLVTGAELYGASEAFSTVTGRHKRFQRSSQFAHRPQEVKLIGVYPSELEAVSAYDAAVQEEALRMGVNPASLPPRRVVIKSCGKHYGIESVGIRSLGCEVRACACAAADFCA